jgi:diamine N-acetyltransferase
VIRIDFVGPDHAPLVGAVGAQAFHEAFGPQNTHADVGAHVESYYAPWVIEREMARDGVRYLLARDGERAVGMAKLAGDPPSSDPSVVLVDPTLEERDGPWLQVCQLYVLESARSRGVGARLMEAMVAEARARGCRGLWLGVWSENPRGIAFYRRLGLAVVGEAVFQLGSDPQRDHVMALRLGE